MKGKVSSLLKKTYVHPYDLPALGMLITRSVQGIIDLTEAVYSSIAGVPRNQPLRGIPGFVFQNIRATAGLVGWVQSALTRLTPQLEDHRSSPERDAILAALNGVLGDYLQASANPLAISMSLRYNGQVINPDDVFPAGSPPPRRKLVVLVHGLCMNESHWSAREHDIGAALARDLGYSVIHLRYNTGLHVSTNGRQFAGLLDRLVQNWPVPLEDLVILSHSMGGLVARSACRVAAQDRQDWLPALRKLVFLGTPHHGSPWERGGAWLQSALGVSAYTAPFARLGRIRSAGITDMRYGSLMDGDWQNRNRFSRLSDHRHPAPLPSGVQCYTIAAARKSRIFPMLNDLTGDGLVSCDSALGIHPESRLCLNFPDERRWIASPVNHLELLRKPEVYAQIRQWLAE